MFIRFNEVEGFSFPEVLLCSATTLMAFSLAECFGRGFDRFPDYQQWRAGQDAGASLAGGAPSAGGRN